MKYLFVIEQAFLEPILQPAEMHGQVAFVVMYFTIGLGLVTVFRWLGFQILKAKMAF